MADRPKFKPNHPDCIPEDQPVWISPNRKPLEPEPPHPEVTPAQALAALKAARQAVVQREAAAKEEEEAKRKRQEAFDERERLRRERLQAENNSPGAQDTFLETLIDKIVNARVDIGAKIMQADEQSTIDYETDAFSLLRAEASGTPFQSAMNALMNATPNEAVREAWEGFLEWYSRDLSALTRRVLRKPQSTDGIETPKQGEASRQEGERLIGTYLEAVKEWYEQTQVQQSATIALHTSEEITAYTTAQADGRTGKGYIRDDQAQTLTHTRGRSHRVCFALTDSDIAGGLTLNDLERFIADQDVDGVLTTHYVLGLLLPPDGLLPNTTPTATIDLNDLVRKTGFDPRTSAEWEDARRKVYQYLRFGEHARVVGVRTVPYKEKRTGKVLNTAIDATLWNIGVRQRPVQLETNEWLEVPVRVEIALTRAWVPLLAHPDLRQYLPLGEILASIPGRQPGGAWARIIGLALANFWRCHTRETINQTMKPTRRQLLTHYTPKVAEPTDVLNGNDPGRARGYWSNALQILKQQGFVANEGEAAKPNPTRPSRQGWQEAWLNEEVELWPGENMRLSVKELADDRPVPKPRDLTQPRRGRPKKQIEPPL